VRPSRGGKAGAGGRSAASTPAGRGGGRSGAIYGNHTNIEQGGAGLFFGRQWHREVSKETQGMMFDDRCRCHRRILFFPSC
jgi:hypothetical protein